MKQKWSLKTDHLGEKGPNQGLEKEVYQSAWASVTKCYRLGGLNNRNIFLSVLEAGNPRSRCSVWCGLSPCLADGCLTVSSHGGEREISSSSYKATVLLDQGPIPMISLNLNLLLKTLFLHTVILTVRASIYKFGLIKIQSMARRTEFVHTHEQTISRLLE